MAYQYVLNVMSDDHPGIVAAVSSVIESLGGGINSCSQTVLGGYFTLIMIVTLPEVVAEEQIAEKIQTLGNTNSTSHHLQVLVRQVENHANASPKGPYGKFVITAFGQDQPGIVRRFSEFLAGKDINIVDLFGEVRDGQFVLIGQLEVPDRWDVRMFQADLDEIGQELHFTVRLQHENIFVATNQLRMRIGG
ncbi:MAG: hypothetical protein PHE53_07315 [Thermoguttaceae bacterium]|nr:hypothetical protein [Thermoguttaceae bacterium]